MVKTILFDFDGTIADSIPLIIKIVNDVLKTYGYSQISNDDIFKMKDKTIPTIFSEKKINYFFLPFMFLHGKLIFRKKRSEIKPIIGIKDVILELKENGYQIGIVTSNSRDSIELFLKLNDFPNIDFLYTSINLFGKGVLIKKCLEEHNLDKDKTIYIGDEIRDIEASKKAGIKCIAVGWGFNSIASLKKAQPIFVIENVKELLKKIQSLKI